MTNKISEALKTIEQEVSLLRAELDTQMEKAKQLELKLSELQGSYKDGIRNIIAGNTLGKDSLSVFSSYAFDPGKPIFHAVFNKSCWALSLPLYKISWHDTYLPYPTLGRSVAITPRHIIVTEHGTEAEFWQQSWISLDGVIITRRTIDTEKGIGKTGYKGYEMGFRVLYLESDLPKDFITPLIKPSEAMSLKGCHVLVINAQREALIHEIENDLLSGHIELKKIPSLGVLSKPLVGGDSGSPVFLIKNKELVYLTNITNSNSVDHATAPNSIVLYNQIIEACKKLNSRWGGSYLP